MVRETAALGILLALVAGLVGRAVAGPAGFRGAVAFGGLAVVLQVIAVALAAPKIGVGDYQGFLSRWTAGIGLRFLGVVVLPAAVLTDRAAFPPLASALGYLGVLVPLLFFEIRRFR